MPFPRIDPVMLDLGIVQIHWYGMMYLVGFAAAWFLLRRRARLGRSPWGGQQVDDLIFYCVLGVILGGRVGYVLFYNFDALLADPLMLIRLWEGGMSFHGGLIGVTLAGLVFSGNARVPALVVADHLAWVTPIGLAAGRLGNFINAELWGRVTDVPWGVVFPGAGPLARHPSQLYEFVGEGLLLFVVLSVYWRRARPAGTVAGLFLLGYGLARIGVEFFREPDAHIGFIAADWLTMGHALSVPMVLVGGALLVLNRGSTVRH
ncbi:MAG: prolipoprotein diacylglyceryl transferase [Pseudomonadota bacterium]